MLSIRNGNLNKIIIITSGEETLLSIRMFEVMRGVLGILVRKLFSEFIFRDFDQYLVTPCSELW